MLKKNSRPETVWSTKSAPENVTKLIHSSRFITTKNGIPTDQIDTQKLKENYSNIYKKGYLARKDHNLQNKEEPIDFSLNRHHSMPKQSSFQEKRENFVSKQSNFKSKQQNVRPMQPQPNAMFEQNKELDFNFKMFSINHDEKFNKFLSLMEKHNKMKEESLSAKNISTKNAADNNRSRILNFFKSLFSGKKISNLASKQEADLFIKDVLENDSELKNFIDLVEKHDESFEKFQKLLKEKDMLDNQSDLNEADRNNFKFLVKRRQNLTSIVRNEMISLNTELEITESEN